jgi:hypothetical protein
MKERRRSAARSIEDNSGRVALNLTDTHFSIKVLAAGPHRPHCRTEAPAAASQKGRGFYQIVDRRARRLSAICHSDRRHLF